MIEKTNLINILIILENGFKNNKKEYNFFKNIFDKYEMKGLVKYIEYVDKYNIPIITKDNIMVLLSNEIILKTMQQNSYKYKKVLEISKTVDYSIINDSLSRLVDVSNLKTSFKNRLINSIENTISLCYKIFKIIINEEQKRKNKYFTSLQNILSLSIYNPTLDKENLLDFVTNEAIIYKNKNGIYIKEESKIFKNLDSKYKLSIFPDQVCKINFTSLLLVYILDKYLKRNLYSRKQRKQYRKDIEDLAIQEYKLEINEKERKIIHTRYEDLYKIFKRPYLLKSIIKERKEFFDYRIIVREGHEVINADPSRTNYGQYKNYPYNEKFIKELNEFFTIIEESNNTDNTFLECSAYAQLYILNIISLCDNNDKELDYKTIVKNLMHEYKLYKSESYEYRYNSALKYIYRNFPTLYYDLITQINKSLTNIFDLYNVFKTLDLKEFKTSEDLYYEYDNKFYYDSMYTNINIIRREIIHILFSYNNQNK